MNRCRMRAIVVEAAHVVGLRDVPVPSIGPGEALIRTAYAGICATDFGIVEGLIPNVCYPHIPGHEWSGIVADVGSPEDGGLVDQRVVGENFITCGRCAACRQGRWNACPESREVGFQLPGGYGEYFVTRASHLRVLPATVLLRDACLLEPTAVSVYAAKRTGIRSGDGVVIAGDGPIGLILLQLSLLQGASSVIVIGGREGRLALARTLGASATINYHRELDIASAVTSRQTQTDVAIEASGSPAALQAVFAVLGQSGRLGVVGDYAGQSVTLDPATIVHRNLMIIGSNASPGTWDTALRLAASGQVRLSPLISDAYPIEEWQTALDVARSHRSDAVKVVLSFGSPDLDA
jgi:2-desacetyl-2-hydroxyethyl bacteriochlorophyllide A dehydrogenase